MPHIIDIVLNNNCPSFLVCYYDKILTKRNFRKERFIWVTGYTPGTPGKKLEAGPEVDTVEAHCLLACT